MNTSGDKGRAKSVEASQRPAAILAASGLDAYPGAALVLDKDGRIETANRRAEPLLAAIAGGRIARLKELLSGEPLDKPVVETVFDGGALHFLELTALPAEFGRILLLARDITLERNLRSALVESRQRYKDLVEISSDFAWEVGPDGRFVFVSPKGALGYSADELVGRHPREFMAGPGAGQGAGQDASPFAAALPMEDAEVWVRQADGSQACLLASAMPLAGEEDEWRGARGVCRDVTQERMRDAALARANNRERLLSYIVRTLRDEVDPANMLKAAAEAAGKALLASGCQIFRLDQDATDFALGAQYGQAGDGSAVLDSFLQSDHCDREVEGWHVLSTVCRYHHSINGALLLWRAHDKGPWSDDDRLLIDDLANQIGLAIEQIANHERILTLSRTDALTGLFNRRAFFEEIARRFKRLAREGKAATLIYVDLDNFKAVNDVHGHQVGDQALMAVRDLLLQHSRPVDLVARLGGDEFAIWLEGAEAPIAERRCAEVLAAGKALDRYSGSADRPLHMSLGAAVHTGGSGETLDELVARADHAMYTVKRDGKAAYRLAPAHGGAAG